MKQILESTIKYLNEYLDIVLKENKENGIMFSGTEGNLVQLIDIYKKELEKLEKEGK